MFNLGSNDKEELQENMQEIKNLIQDDDGAGKPSSNQGGNAGGLGSPNQSQQNQQPQNSFEEKVQQSAEKEQQDLGDQVDFSQSQSSGQNQQNQQQPSQEQVLNNDDGNDQQEQESQDLSRKFNTQSGSSPNEPMFLREEEFLNVREMIEEMGYLTKEIENNLDKLKKTVHQERSTSKNAMELVQAFSQRRAEIESTIESGQK